MKKHRARRVVVELYVVADAALTDEQLEIIVEESIEDQLRHRSFTVVESFATTQDDVEELDALREIAHTYARQGIIVAEHYINSDGAR